MNFDKCDGGLPCMCPTTGCQKGQCARRLHPQAGLDWSLPARLRRVATTLGDAMHNEAADRIDELERALRAALVERGELALKLAGAECYIKERGIASSKATNSNDVNAEAVAILTQRAGGELFIPNGPDIKVGTTWAKVEEDGVRFKFVPKGVQ